MARAGSSRALALLALLALAHPAGLAADLEQDDQARKVRQADEAVWQAVFGERVVTEARKQLGQPYVWGGKSQAQGFDCSGYTAWVYRSLGVDIGVSALQQYQQGVSIPRAGLLPGDLVFFLGSGAPLHVGIYAGDGQFLHAPGAGKRIESSKIDGSYFGARFLAGRRVVPALAQEQQRRGAALNANSKTGTPPSKETAP
ncbi:MAG TPA: C40 family peptidase [bacterium]|nr:C40 family peptidase [bacterium]